MLPHARRDGLRDERIGNDTVVHDSAHNRTHHLDPVAALLWRHCNGRTSITALARRLQSELGIAAGEERIWQELEHLEAAGLLREPLCRPDDEPAISRRELVGLLGRTSVLLLVAPAYFPSRSHAEPTVRVGTSHPEYARELTDVFLEGGIVIPEGQTWKCGPNVRTNGNVVVHGHLVMRPGAGLKFQGVDSERFVGGGMTLSPAVQGDTGLWVQGRGMLDIQGTPKAGWNRTGRDPTWRPGDEYYIAPTDPGDYTPRRWRPGQPIPRVHPEVPPAEVMNVTRDIVFEGPGHIHIHSQVPQRIEYVQLRGLGASNRASEGPVLGRYALHLHHAQDGSRGTVIRGVAAVDSRGRVLVPHESNGIRIEDFVSVNSLAQAFWWDDGDHSHDIVIDRMCVSGVYMPRSVSGKTSRREAVALHGGSSLIIRNSAVSGARGHRLSHGVRWRNSNHRSVNSIWDFRTNVAHNNQGAGLRFWTNGRDQHVTRQSVTYRNGLAGISDGAYINSTRYEDMLLVEDHIEQLANAKGGLDDRRAPYFERVRVYANDGPALVVGRLRLFSRDASANYLEFIDCTLQPGPGAPKVLIGSDRKVENPFMARFRNCGVTPDDVEFVRPIPQNLAGSTILIEEKGQRWEITLDMQRGRKIVRGLERFPHPATD